ncbi:MAG: PLP-dependent transferase [Candidatus Cryptobacteroides sp.]
MKKQTKALHTAYPRKDAYGALSMPVYHAAAFEFDNAAEMSDVFCGRVIAPDYSRVMNPTVTNFEDRVKALTGASSVVALNSGMAAISNTLFGLVRAGGNIVTSRHMFGNTFSFITETLPRLGVEPRLKDLTDLAQVEAAVDGNTACIYLEIITNPQMEVADLSALSEIARRHGIPLVADTTMIPFTEFSSSALGVDIEVVSSTKYLSGGATSIGGLILDYGHFPEFTRMTKGELLFNLGAYMTPHVAYMQTLGLETLNARYAVQSSNALEIARRLSRHPAVRHTGYTGLEDNPFHELSARQFGPTAGAMVTIDLESQEACFKFIDSLKLVYRATNLFDSRSLAIHPYSTIFGPFSAEKKREMDVLDTTIRLSIGLEDVDDIYADLCYALDAAAGK